jgi:5-enolpyruvylshikimate-3-phosphate synthase
MTLNQMEQFGFSAKATRSANAIPISPGGYSPSSFYAIEPDAPDRPNRSDHRFA